MRKKRVNKIKERMQKKFRDRNENNGGKNYGKERNKLWKNKNEKIIKESKEWKSKETNILGRQA